MYNPKKFKIEDLPTILSHIESHPLGTWVCFGIGGLTANHIPFVLQEVDGRFSLIGHVSVGNNIWKELEYGKDSIVTFIGPQAYITPNWYPSKQQHGKVVPTWNYSTVHVSGVARAIHDDVWKLNMLERLTDSQEKRWDVPWSVNDAPRDYISKKLRGIVGVEIQVSGFDGKLKASQDEEPADRLATAEKLKLLSSTESNAVGDLVKRAIYSKTE